MSRNRWLEFIEHNSTSFPARQPREQETVASALLLLSPWNRRRECPTVELEGRYYPEMCDFAAIGWAIGGRAEGCMDPFDVLYGDEDAAA